MEDVRRLRLRLARWLAAAGGGLLAVLLLLGLAAGAPPALSAGEPAPPFDLALFEGGRITNADLAGRVAVLNVWASWCPPCREEAPALRRVHAASDPERVAFLGVLHRDDVARAERFVQEYGLAYANADDDGSFARAYGVRGIPMTFVLGADGTLLAQHFGPISESRLRVLVDDALARAALATAAP